MIIPVLVTCHTQELTYQNKIYTYTNEQIPFKEKREKDNLIYFEKVEGLKILMEKELRDLDQSNKSLRTKNKILKKFRD